MLPNRILLSFFLCTKGNNKCFYKLTRPKAAHGFSPYGQLPMSPWLIPGCTGSLGAGRASSSWTTRLPPGWNCGTQLSSREVRTSHWRQRLCARRKSSSGHQDTAEPGPEGSNCRSTRKLLVWPQTSHGMFSISVYSSKERIK